MSPRARALAACLGIVSVAGCRDRSTPSAPIVADPLAVASVSIDAAVAPPPTEPDPEVDDLPPSHPFRHEPTSIGVGRPIDEALCDGRDHCTRGRTLEFDAIGGDAHAAIAIEIVVAGRSVACSSADESGDDSERAIEWWDVMARDGRVVDRRLLTRETACFDGPARRSSRTISALSKGGRLAIAWDSGLVRMGSFWTFASVELETRPFSIERFRLNDTKVTHQCTGEVREWAGPAVGAPRTFDVEFLDPPDGKRATCRRIVHSWVVPQVELPDDYAIDGWRTTSLGACGLSVTGTTGFVVGGRMPSPADASFRVVDADGTLILEVTDDVPIVAGARVDTIELWSLPESITYMDAWGPTPDFNGAITEVSRIGLDGRILTGHAKARATRASANVTRLVISDLPPHRALTVVYRDTDDARTEGSALATSELDRAHKTTLGRVGRLPNAVELCTLTGTTLTPTRRLPRWDRVVF